MKMGYWALIVNVTLLIWSTIIIIIARRKLNNEIDSSWKVLFLLFILLHSCTYVEVYLKLAHFPGSFLLRGIQLLLGVIMCVYSFECIYSRKISLQESMMYLIFIGLSTCSIILRYI